MFLTQKLILKMRDYQTITSQCHHPTNVLESQGSQTKPTSL